MSNQEIEKTTGSRFPIIKAGFDLEANRKNYQLLLQNLAAITVTKDNVNEDLTKDGREILKALTEKKDEESKEPLQWHKDIMAAYKSLHDPLKVEVDRILAGKKVVADEIREETRVQLVEQTRITSAKTAIVDFTNKVANLIKTAKDDNDIVNIEKMIGLEKTKKNLYQEFLPDLIIQCDGLRPQIKEQKENIRQLQTIQKKEEAALASGQVYEAAALREEREHIETVIAETGIRIHEKAYDQAIQIDIVAPEVIDTAPKGRTNWKWKVEDIKLLQKKMPHLVKLVPDEAAINSLLTTMRLEWKLKDKLEEKWNGITFYNDIKHIR